ncbi:MAG: hypothetical protein CMP23_06665 [Rickettsiales bacterium]|nr:hypothetical protein [Rickettsiales bacterium]
METTFYGVALIISLLLCWSSWKSESSGQQQTNQGPIVVFEPGSGGLSELHWRGEKAVASLSFAGKGEEQTAWVQAGKRERIEGPQTAPAGDDDDSASQAREPAKPVYGEPALRSFPGGKQVAELIERFKPLVALRKFNDLDAATLSEMGLDDPASSLTVSSLSGKKLELSIGDKAYGSSDTYALETGTANVYLLSSKVLGALRSAEGRLMERNILGFDAMEASEVRLSAPGGSTRKLRHEGTHDEANAYWSDPDAPEQQESTDGFMKKLLNLRAIAYPLDTERISDDQVERILRADFPGKPAAHIELGRVRDETRSKEDEPAWDWHARTQLTRDVWVKVSRNSGLELYDNLQKLLDP